MNGRHARGWGIRAHEMTNTTTKKAANSIVGKLTAGILAVAAVLLAGPPPAEGVGGPVLVIGDSLEVGSGPHLRAALAGTPVAIDAERSRSSTAGLRALASKLRDDHEVVVFALGTNDLSASTLGSNLAAAQELAGGRCMVVATIARPNQRGSSSAELNRVVEAFASQSGAQVMDWRSAALSTPGALGRDRIHATGQGYALRGSLLAEAVQACLLGGDLGGLPAPEDPNVRVPDPPRPERRRPRRVEPPARVPVAAALRSLMDMAGPPLSLVGGAASDARTAAMKPEPEPVLGAPE
jgi:lysophospholipase L1-like esterase